MSVQNQKYFDYHQFKNNIEKVWTFKRKYRQAQHQPFVPPENINSNLASSRKLIKSLPVLFSIIYIIRKLML